MTTETHDELAKAFDLAEADANAAEFFTNRSTGLLRAFAEWLPMMQKQRLDWLTADDDEAKLIRRVHARLAGEKTRTPRGQLITVQEFADKLGVSRSTADRLLAEGRVHGAVRKTPGVKNSPWLIPEAAVERHFDSWEPAA
jgi:hypothetical protein